MDVKTLMAAGIFALSPIGITLGAGAVDPTELGPQSDPVKSLIDDGGSDGGSSGGGGGSSSIELCPTTGIWDQGVIDTGVLTLWDTEPLYLLAGHNTDGWDWIDTVPNGTIVEVTCGAATGTYEVYDHKWQSGDGGGPYPGWFYDGADLALQTCTGLNGEANGLGWSLLREVD